MINPNKVQECHVYKIIIELITLIKEDNILATVVIIEMVLLQPPVLLVEVNHMFHYFRNLLMLDT